MDQLKRLSGNVMSKIKTPSFKMPSIKTPSFKIPSIKTPKLNTPNIVKNTLAKTTTNLKSLVNIKDILIIFGIFMSLVVISVILILSGISFKEKTRISGDSYVLEGYGGEDDLDINVDKEIDEKNCSGTSKEIDNACSLHEENLIGGKKKCNKSSCCIWIEKNKTISKPKCIQGDIHGPTKKEMIEKLGIDEYYFQNKKKK